MSDHHKISIPTGMAKYAGVAVGYRHLGPKDEISVQVEGGFSRKTLGAPAIIYVDAKGNEMIVYDEDESE